jgi:hypothetical protein
LCSAGDTYNATPYLAGRAWHLFLQVLLFHKKPPAVRVTEAAKRQLAAHLSRITEFEPAASIVWSSNVVDGVTHPPRWGVAFYDIGRRPSGRVVSIDGVPFVFTQVRAYTHLNGATLDYRDGRFVVNEGT